MAMSETGFSSQVTQPVSNNQMYKPVGDDITASTIIACLYV